TSPGQPVAGASVQEQVVSLEREIREQRRLLELKSRELAELQRRLAASTAPAAVVPTEPSAPAPGETAVAPEDDSGVVTAPVKEAREPKTAARQEPKPAAEEAAGPSFFDSLTENWLFLLGAAGLVLVGGLAYGFVRRRREQDAHDALQGFEIPSSAPVPSETMRLRALALGETQAGDTGEFEAVDEESFVVEERPRPVERPAPEAAPAVGQEETISTEAAIDLDQADPLAEADFHMAYGLYDQACDLVRMALKQSPERNDLKLKLAEIHFVAGDAQAFLGVARDLRKTLGPGGDWDRVVIMGRQLVPNEAMFAGGMQSTGVDLSLEGGDSRVDLDLLSMPGGDGGMDVDLGQGPGGADGESITDEREVVDFNLDEDLKSLGATQKITPRRGSSTVEMPTLELPAADAPTVETPALHTRGGNTVREKLKSTDLSSAISADSTAEMAIDDLGLDIGDIPGEPDSQADATMRAPHAEETMRMPPRDERTEIMQKAGNKNDATGIARISDAERTALLESLDSGDEPELDLDVGRVTEETSSPTTSTGRLSTEQLPHMADLEPVTLSEVGTKLDLARAYMDMGDPDGARNILQEVLTEGSASQKQEARQLIESLPGA
ncbi:MAG: FimV/HubP family polar landmark protein, partial [Steroidobacteraceae bacterium]